MYWPRCRFLEKKSAKKGHIISNFVSSFGHCREILDVGLDVLTSLSLCQYIKVSVWDFPVLTERTKLILSGIEKSFKAYLEKYTLPFIAASEHPSLIQYPRGFLKIARKRLPMVPTRGKHFFLGGGRGYTHLYMRDPLYISSLHLLFLSCLINR